MRILLCVDAALAECMMMAMIKPFGFKLGRCLSKEKSPAHYLHARAVTWQRYAGCEYTVAQVQELDVAGVSLGPGVEYEFFPVVDTDGRGQSRSERSSMRVFTGFAKLHGPPSDRAPGSDLIP
jgi:hypothetical protein